MFLRQGHAAAVVDKKAYIFGGSSGSWFGGEHSESTSDPVYLNDLFVLKSKLLHKVCSQDPSSVILYHKMLERVFCN